MLKDVLNHVISILVAEEREQILHELLKDALGLRREAVLKHTLYNTAAVAVHRHLVDIRSQFVDNEGHFLRW